MTENTVNDFVIRNCMERPDHSSYTFLADFGDGRTDLSNRDLLTRSWNISQAVLEHARKGDRALIILPPGLDYLCTFYGCLLGGVIAVPCYPPVFKKGIEKIMAVIQSAQPKVIIAPKAFADQIQMFTQGTGISLVCPEDVENPSLDGVVPDISKPDDIAFLQYTSGSTGNPKGVMVTHGNLIHNLEAISESFKHSPDNRGVIWLPPYHDMGLIGGILQPLYLSASASLMSPFNFIRSPFSWLKEVSDTPTLVTSGGPNFAYQLCVDKITDEQLEQLDLSKWSVAFTGAEPINHAVLERFTEKFAPVGFNPDAFLPCYGLAESTLIVTGKLGNPAVVKGRVSCGPAVSDIDVKIVNPDTHCEVSAGEEGEVWVSGDSVAAGYWKNKEATEATFNQSIIGGNELNNGTYMRTGDLGYFADNELFITGRIKDVIISSGTNLYPQDIEIAAQDATSEIRRGNVAAFGITEDGVENVVVVCEIKKDEIDNLDETAVKQAVTAAVMKNVGAKLHDIALVEAGEVSKTTSGKIARSQTKKDYLGQQLKRLCTPVTA